VKENQVAMKIIQYLTERLVDRSPATAFKVLEARHKELLLPRVLNRPDVFKWSELDVPQEVEGFEDLSFLFWRSPLNRGFIRLDLDEAAALYKVVKNLPHAQGVEIGRMKGGSTLMLASAVGPHGRLLSIDIEPHDDQALKNILRQMNLLERVELLIADANQVEHESHLDFVFIDGDHSYEGARKDHNKWGAKVRRGGFIIHHDMGNGRPLSSQWESLAKLMSEIKRVQQDVLELVHEVGSMMIFRRRDHPWKSV
jgi:predicted O-methyltransferase YrrM